MGLSYHDETSFVETAASWHFAPQNQNSISEIEDREMASLGQERPGHVCIHLHEDLDIIDRLPS
jgi:hypothetical protein